MGARHSSSPSHEGLQTYFVTQPPHVPMFLLRVLEVSFQIEGPLFDQALPAANHVAEGTPLGTPAAKKKKGSCGDALFVAKS